MPRPTIGFIGLGAMGEPMAGRLLDAGFRVVSSINRSREAIERLAAKGIEELGTPRDVGEHADILMAGGDKATIERCREVFDVLGTTMHCGGVGAGQAMKIGNNAIALGTWALVQEVREVVGAYGMELDRFMEILNVSTGRSFVSKNFPMPRRRVTWPAMPVKDLSLCLDVARDFDVEAPLVKASLDSGQPAVLSAR